MDPALAHLPLAELDDLAELVKILNVVISIFCAARSTRSCRPSAPYTLHPTPMRPAPYTVLNPKC